MAGTIKRFLIRAAIKTGVRKERRKYQLGSVGSVRNPITEKNTPLFVRWRKRTQVTSDTRKTKHRYPGKGTHKGK